MGRKRIDRSGQRYGRLVIVEPAGRRRNIGLWLCRCDCGSEKIVEGPSLQYGRTVSCGCLNKERVRETHTKHGAYKTRLYHAWQTMRARCNNPTCKAYRLYGARGIRVCERWESFDAFASDMGEPPFGLSLDRIDNDGHYEPGNCRWATHREQMLNTRRNVHITIEGETKTVSEWSARYGVPQHRVYCRMSRGWDAVRALTAPKGARQ